MAKTVRLLATYNGRRPGSIVRVAEAAAAELLLHGNATEDLTGGTYVEPEKPAVVYNATPPAPSPNPGGRGLRYPRGSISLSGRQASLAPFPFAVVGGGAAPAAQKHTASTINTTYAAGIPGVLERTSDAAALTTGQTSTVPADELYAWWLRCQPTHTVIDGRPRAYIQSPDLPFYRHQRMYIKFRPYHKDSVGWFNMNEKMPNSGLWALTQQSGTPPFQFDTDQLGAGASPIYIKQQGAAVFVEVHVPADDMAATPTDSPDGNGRSYVTWNVGDKAMLHKKSRPKALDGRLYHEIVVDFFLDPRRKSEGGEGYYRCYFDGEVWFEYEGATCLPPNAAGLLMPCSGRFGYYEVSSGTQAAGTLNSAVDAPNGPTAAERSFLIRDHYYAEGV